MSRYSKASTKDPALTVGYGWDPGLASFFAWVAPDGGDCEADELVVDVGNMPGEIADAQSLCDLLDASGHGALSAAEVAQLRADQGAQGATVRAPALQKLLDAMLQGANGESAPDPPP